MQTSNSTVSVTKVRILLPPNTVLNGFYCACGVFFQQEEQFKNHGVVEHDGFFVAGSSHYVAPLSQNVRLCDYWDPSVLINKNPVVVKNANVAPIAKNEQTYQFTPTKEVQLKNRREKHSELNTASLDKTPNNPKVEETNDSEEENKQPRQSLHQVKKENIVQQQFSFCANSFLKEQKTPLKFDQLCQSHNNSPLIESIVFEVTSDQDRSIYTDQSTPTFIQVPKPAQKGEKENTRTVESRRQNIKRQTMFPLQNKSLKQQKMIKIYSKISSALVPSYMLKIFKFLSNKQLQLYRKKNVTFRCGCGKLIKNANNNSVVCKHIIAFHQQILPTNSSHIFLRKNTRNGSQRELRMVGVKEVEENDFGWFCPCRYGVDMTKAQLIKHVYHIHKGISPIYELPLFVPHKKIKH